METKMLDGREAAKKIRDEVAEDIRRTGSSPGLGVILVGDDPASHLYVGLKEKACREAGIRFEKRLFPADATQEAVLDAVRSFNERQDIDAVLVQLPLPPHLDEDLVAGAVQPEKDVDGFHPENLRAFMEGAGRMPGLIEAVMTLIGRSGMTLSGASAAVFANSPVFVRPMRKALERAGARVIETSSADVVVTALGKPRWLTRDEIKPGAVVIDIGTSRLDGKTVGDADFAGLQGVASAITPVPGGVGPMTVAMLLKNTLELAKK